MRRLFIACVLICSLIPTFSSSPVRAATASCSDFDSWEWAQTVYDNDEATHAALDPDGNGSACDELPHGGFAPTTWTSQIPVDTQAAKLIRIIDGDTFEVEIDGVSNRVRIYRADTPETQNETQCGGQQATDFITLALGFSDASDGIVYLEKDKTARDKYGRELAYIWFNIDGQPYMLNELLIRSGWADDVDYGDRKYDAHLKSAKAFAEQHDLGVWSLCGGFGVSTGGSSTAGQVPATTGSSSGNGTGGGSTTDQPVQDAPVSAPVEVPVAVAPVEEAPAVDGGCNPNYSPCVPNSASDLDCKDIGFSVSVIGSDQYGFDRDADGIGCESN